MGLHIDNFFIFIFIFISFRVEVEVRGAKSDKAERDGGAIM